MDKYAYLTEAIKNGLPKKLKWIASTLGIPIEEEDAWKKDPYYLRLVRTNVGTWYVNEQKELSPILTGKDILVIDKKEPMYWPATPYLMPANTMPNQTDTIDTTVGLAIQNYLLLACPFGSRIPYINKEFGMSTIESIIIKNFKSNFEPDDPSAFYVRDRVKLAQYKDYMEGFSPIVSIAGTRKLMTAPPGIIEYKNKLVEENKDRINELAVVASINAKLVAYDAAYLKDDPGQRNLGSKDTDIIRQKLYLMLGAEEGLESNGVTGTTVTKSLQEGIDLNNFPAYVNNSRNGSYSRGKQTQDGGVSVKEILRGSSALSVGLDDCGTKVGAPAVVGDEVKPFIGHTIIYNGKSIKINKVEDLEPYKNKLVYIRYPSYCIGPKTDYCRACLGDILSNNPHALSSALTNIGSIYMLVAMKAMHGKALKTVDFIYSKHIV